MSNLTQGDEFINSLVNKWNFLQQHIFHEEITLTIFCKFILRNIWFPYPS